MKEAPYQKERVGITDIMRLYKCSYPKAKEMLNETRRLENSSFGCLENQVLLTKLLESRGVENFDFWLHQQMLKNGDYRFIDDTKESATETKQSTQTVFMFQKKLEAIAQEILANAEEIGEPSNGYKKGKK